MRHFKAALTPSVIRLIIFLVLFGSILYFASYTLTYMPDKIFLTKFEFDNQTNVDVAIIGNSLFLAGANPFIIEQQLGEDVDVFNLSVGQATVEDFYFMAKRMFQKYNPSVMILQFEVFDLCPNSAYFQENPNVQREINFLIPSPITKMEYISLNATRYGDWLERLMPWRFISVSGISKLSKEINELINPNAMYESVLEQYNNKTDYNHLGKGYEYRDVQKTWDESDYENALVASSDGVVFTQEKQKTYLSIANMCRDKNCKLLIVSPPWHPSKIMGDMEYLEALRTMKEFCDRNEIEFLDWAMVKPAYMADVAEYYYDYYHLNGEGAMIFSESLGHYLSLMGTDGVADDWFYQSYEEYLMNEQGR